MKFYTCVLLVVLSSTISFAKDNSPWDFTLNVDWASQYIGSTCGVFYDHPVVQESLTVSHKSGFYLNVFHSGECSSEWANNENAWANEVDYTLGFAGKIGELDFDASASYWDCGQMFDKELDFVNLNLKLSKTFELNKKHSLKPFVKFSDYRSVNSSPWDGFRFYTGICHNWKFNEKLAINSEASVVYDDGMFANPSGIAGKLSTVLNWKISDSLSLNLPRLTLYTPLQGLSNDRKTEIVFGGGLTYKF